MGHVGRARRSPWRRRPVNGRCEVCDKPSYPTDLDAITVALKRSRRGGRPLRYYRCPAGLGWHLTKRVTLAKGAA